MFGRTHLLNYLVLILLLLLGDFCLLFRSYYSLFRFSNFSWFSLGRWYICRNLYISYRLYNLGGCFPVGTVGKNTRCKGQGIDPWVGKIPRSRKWQVTPILLPGKFHGQRSLTGCSPWGHKELDTAEQLSTHIQFFVI